MRAVLAGRGLAAALLLSGCAALEPPPPAAPASEAQAARWQEHWRRVAALPAWGAAGRFGIHAGGGGVHGDFDWRQAGGRFALQLSGPFGVGAVRLEGDLATGEATLADGGEVRRGRLADLLREQVGFDLPVRALLHLARGVPLAEDAGAAEVLLDAEARAARIRQRGWQVEYRDYGCCEEPRLPGRVRFAHPAMRGALAVREWRRE